MSTVIHVNFEAHHILPAAVWDKLAEDFKAVGFFLDKDATSNKILLAKTPEMAKFIQDNPGAFGGAEICTDITKGIIPC